MHQLFLTFVSKTLSRDAFLQKSTQLNLHAIVSLGPIVHQQEVGVVVIEAGQSALALGVYQIMGWETSLWTKRRRVRRRERKAEEHCTLRRPQESDKPLVSVCLAYLWMHQSAVVVNYSPCCYSDSHDLALHGVAQGVVPHSPPHMLHHTCVRTTGDDPRTCVQHSICPDSMNYVHIFQKYDC